MRFREGVERITIFGSAVTSAANPCSDIDIFVDASESLVESLPKRLPIDSRYVVDLWTTQMLAGCDSTDFLKSVRETGVVLWSEN